MNTRCAITVTLVMMTAMTIPVVARADQSDPVGHWYLDVDGHHVSADIAGGSGQSYSGSLTNDDGTTESLNDIAWDRSTRQLQFRSDGVGRWRWFSGGIVEGIFVGRFSLSTTSAGKPTAPTDYRFHVTGWNSTYLDTAIVPRVWDILVNNDDRVCLRIDKGSSGFIGTLKIYSKVSDPYNGEQLLYDLGNIGWDGTNLTFTQQLDDGTLRIYQATVSGRDISGTYSPGNGSFSGTRIKVLTYGLAGKTDRDRLNWSIRTRVQLYHLMMADDPDPLSRSVTVLSPNLYPTPSVNLPPNRDDNPLAWPQNYTKTELRFDYTLPNPYGGAPLTRSVHGFLAVPTTPPPSSGKYPAVLALNGHDGSAWEVMNPDADLYWYGDSYARRGYIVLAIDISHRPLEDRANLYTDYTDGDDPINGNGPHPAIKAAGFDSDWEEDGERCWDAMRAIDYLLSLPNVDPKSLVMTGLSMGGEVTAIAGGMDTRVAVSIPGGFSPDFDVLLYHNGHPCWKWQHADIREYIGASDFLALTAPRPLILETGKLDNTFSARTPRFSGDKQLIRRLLATYSADDALLNHYLHYDGHHYHVGDINPTLTTEQGVRVPNQLVPSQQWSLDWQVDGSTHAVAPTLFDLVQSDLAAAAASRRPFRPRMGPMLSPRPQKQSRVIVTSRR